MKKQFGSHSSISTFLDGLTQKLGTVLTFITTRTYILLKLPPMFLQSMCQSTFFYFYIATRQSNIAFGFPDRKLAARKLPRYAVLYIWIVLRSNWIFLEKTFPIHSIMISINNNFLYTEHRSIMTFPENLLTSQILETDNAKLRKWFGF